MTILKQDLTVEDKTVTLRQTYDIGTAQQLAKEVSAAGGGRVGSGSSSMQLMGYIPPEEWRFNPWLIEATKARNAGDMGEYTKNLRKFFQLFPRYSVITPKKYF